MSWGGLAPTAVVYMFGEDRKAIRAKQLLGDSHGILQVDGYTAYKGLIKNGGRLVQLAFCFAHAAAEVLGRSRRDEVADLPRKRCNDRDVLRH